MKTSNYKGDIGEIGFGNDQKRDVLQCFNINECDLDEAGKQKYYEHWKQAPGHLGLPPHLLETQDVEQREEQAFQQRKRRRCIQTIQIQKEAEEVICKQKAEIFEMKAEAKAKQQEYEAVLKKKEYELAESKTLCWMWNLFGDETQEVMRKQKAEINEMKAEAKGKQQEMVVLLLRTVKSLKQLYTMTMDVHSRFRTESHGDLKEAKEVIRQQNAEIYKLKAEAKDKQQEADTASSRIKELEASLKASKESIKKLEEESGKQKEKEKRKRYVF